MAQSASGHFLAFAIHFVHDIQSNHIKNHKLLSEFLPGNSFVKNSVKSGAHGRLTNYTS